MSPCASVPVTLPVAIAGINKSSFWNRSCISSGNRWQWKIQYESSKRRDGLEDLAENKSIF